MQSVPSRTLKGLLLSAAMLQPATLVHAQDVAAGEQAGADQPLAVGDIVVTATRKATVLSRTPASISAKSQLELDAQGVRSIADIATITPGITFGQNAVAYGTGQTTVSIRGVDSQSGIPTTGIYIDDTPIQTRIGVSPSLGNAYPQVFDLERIEVLRGPQGTLFGSGSVGGAIRFITPGPNYEALSLYGRTELAFTRHGSPSYEGGVAVGAPLVTDKVAFRSSIWYRRDGGYLDELNPYTNQIFKKDSNSTKSFAARLALGFKPSDMVTLTPSIFFQDLKIDDGSRLELATSDVSDGNLRLGLNQRTEPHRDRFFLPALKAEVDLGKVTLISNTSYFDRTTRTINDDTTISYVFFGGLTGKPFPPGFENYAPHTLNNTRQSTFTQELRLQDNDPNDRLNWIVGLFLQRSYVRDQYASRDENLLSLVNYGQTAAGNAPYADLTEAFGTELYQGLYSVFQRNEHRDKQYAAYAQADYEIIDRLKLTAGLRYTIAKYKFAGFGAGPVLATEGQTDNLSTTSKTLTPKFGISFQADHNNLFYASASKGVRGPGVSSPVGSNCTGDAAAIGIDPFATLKVDPDSIWSYEVGSKSRFAGGKVALDASAYRIEWKNVQTLFQLPTCAIQTALNLGNARINGFDISLSVKPLKGLTLGGTVAYIDARYTTTILGSDGQPLRHSGEPFPLVAPWSVQLNGEYVHDLGDAELYGRADYSASSRITRPVEVSAIVDPELPRPPSTSQLDLRVGGRFKLPGAGDVDASLFVNNVSDSRPLLAYFHEATGSTFYRAGTFRPRTIGLTVTLHR